MQFKSATVYQLQGATTYLRDSLEASMESLAFTPCPATLPYSLGWIAPLEGEMGEGLIVPCEQTFVFCLQIERKLLPPAVINQAVADEALKIEEEQARKVSQKEKQTLKENLTTALLAKALTKKSWIYAYMDTKTHQVIVNTTAKNQLELFHHHFKKTFTEWTLAPLQLKKVTPTLTRWLADRPDNAQLNVDDQCVLFDPNQPTNTLRCQKQDLHAQGVQVFLHNGYHVKQIGLTFNEQLHFMLNEHLQITRLTYPTDIQSQMREEAEEYQHKQYAALWMSIQLLTALLPILIQSFTQETARKTIGDTLCELAS